MPLRQLLARPQRLPAAIGRTCEFQKQLLEIGLVDAPRRLKRGEPDQFSLIPLRKPPAAPAPANLEQKYVDDGSYAMPILD
ncbi:hypothetical protein GCM10010520_11770 [Rhizobium viscosum]